jgi:methylenetetrahydrofolate reductase (NADPH)
MTIKEKLTNKNHICYSLEFYPPKNDENLNNLKNNLLLMMKDPRIFIKPSFINITCSAGSNISSTTDFDSTLILCKWIQEELNIPACAHMTVGGHKSREQVISNIKKAYDFGINNIMALRGDCKQINSDSELSHASGFVKLIREQLDKKVTIMVASYPEGHSDMRNNPDLDIHYLNEKIKLGADITISQFFLDSKIFIDFRNKLYNLSNVRIIPGIIILASESGLQRMLSLTGNMISVPPIIQNELINLKNNKDEFREFGLQLACRLCKELYQSGERFFIFTH